ncbi:hypothetical protein [Seohaeicola zhoushanensis]|uniref:Holin n=1 Tax=Seohaeicola zhoushanensis TaxID=1569283 RepID=A0A8J3H2W8_9RHOB|nr:hypothetical protein [Seohaeicola zhoushanensis]GHF71258.1 hypothetical protein GCM10017056_47720 [Seohaeicola zhoushanensis]
MGVYIRMIIYALAASAAALGIATYDPVAQTITFDLNSLSLLLGGAVAYVGTFVAGRVAKAKGGSS